MIYNEIKQKIKGQKFNKQSISEDIKFLADEYDISFTIKVANNGMPFFISGSYNLYAEQDIKIYIEISKEYSEIYNDSFRHEIILTICHELIHRYQHESRDSNNQMICKYSGKQSHLKDYYSDKDEIEAYAHDIAIDCIRCDKPKEILKEMLKNKDKCDIIGYIINVFDDNINDKTIKRLIKKTYLWVDHYAGILDNTS